MLLAGAALRPDATVPRDAWSGAGVNLVALAALAAMIVIASEISVRVFRWE